MGIKESYSTVFLCRGRRRHEEGLKAWAKKNVEGYRWKLGK